MFQTAIGKAWGGKGHACDGREGQPLLPRKVMYKASHDSAPQDAAQGIPPESEKHGSGNLRQVIRRPSADAHKAPTGKAGKEEDILRKKENRPEILPI